MSASADHTTLTLQSRVTFGEVDRDHLLHLRGVLKLLQEAAIAHANLFDTGTDAMVTRGESWVLNRLAIGITRYPAYGETLSVQTWSSGIKSFRGYRDFRVRDAAGATLIEGSSLWLFVSTRTLSIIRPPADLAERFPRITEGVWCPDLETLALSAPEADAPRREVTLRYSDFDANRHLNNTAYGDLLQTALAAAGLPARPARLLIRYNKGIPEGAESAAVSLQTAPGAPTRFGIHDGATLAAQGEVA